MTLSFPRRAGRSAPLAVAIVLALLPQAAFACATCGCSLSSDSASGNDGGYSASSGWNVSLLYSFIDQSELRTGSHSTSPGQIAAINNNGGNQEVEHNTTNNYLTLGTTYTPNADWHFNAQLPYIIRAHSTYGAATTDQINDGNLSAVSVNDFGDARFVASYQGILPDNSLGLQLGIKLPTGRYGGQNTVTGAFVGRHPYTFASGPGVGQSLDTSLQPGTGSTDLILGTYYEKAVSQDFDAFANAQFQVAVAQFLDQANANFRPGNVAYVSAGLRYEHTPEWTPQLQINVSHKSADQGALADATDTAGTVVYLSPGISAPLSDSAHIYGIIQVPVKSWLDGYQLFPRWTGSVGLNYAF
jgi:hypothetical protein